MLQARKSEIARKKEELKNIVARHIRSHTYTVLLRQKKRNHVPFKEVFREVRDRIKKSFPEFSDSFGEGRKNLRRDYFITSLLVAGSNLTLISDGEELFVAYTNRLSFYETYLNLRPTERLRSKASMMRQVTRDELSTRVKISLAEMRKAVKRNGLLLRIEALLIKKAQFAIMSEKDGVYITIKNRLNW